MHLIAFFFPIFGCGFILYFLPAIIAYGRSKRDAGAILLRQDVPVVVRLVCGGGSPRGLRG